MRNLLTVFNKTKGQQDLKERVLKNREGVLDAIAENIKGAKQCPFLLGQKCLGVMCEQFMEFKTVNSKTGENFTYWRCSFVQTPLLIIELNRNIVALMEAMKKDV